MMDFIAIGDAVHIIRGDYCGDPTNAFVVKNINERGIAELQSLRRPDEIEYERITRLCHLPRDKNGNLLFITDTVLFFEEGEAKKLRIEKYYSYNSDYVYASYHIVGPIELSGRFVAAELVKKP